ncbi:MAG: hypothetical protein KUG64_10695 [Cycloclasticus sp.]|nr:hypothetical protein [Cycloclasticus sp.]
MFGRNNTPETKEINEIENKEVNEVETNEVETNEVETNDNNEVEETEKEIIVEVEVEETEKEVEETEVIESDGTVSGDFNAGITNYRFLAKKHDKTVKEIAEELSK